MSEVVGIRTNQTAPSALLKDAHARHMDGGDARPFLEMYRRKLRNAPALYRHGDWDTMMDIAFMRTFSPLCYDGYCNQYYNSVGAIQTFMFWTQFGAAEPRLGQWPDFMTTMQVARFVAALGVASLPEQSMNLAMGILDVMARDFKDRMGGEVLDMLRQTPLLLDGKIGPRILAVRNTAYNAT